MPTVIPFATYGVALFIPVFRENGDFRSLTQRVCLPVVFDVNGVSLAWLHLFRSAQFQFAFWIVSCCSAHTCFEN